MQARQSLHDKPNRSSPLQVVDDADETYCASRQIDKKTRVRACVRVVSFTSNSLLYSILQDVLAPQIFGSNDLTDSISFHQLTSIRSF